MRKNPDNAPVFISGGQPAEKEKKGMGPGEIARIVIVTLVIIFAAYYAVYYMAVRRSKLPGGREIKICERFSLSKDKMICVIEAKGKAYLTVITGGGATVLDTYDIPDSEKEEFSGSGNEYGGSAVPRGLTVISKVPGAIFKTLKRAFRPGAETPGGDFNSFMKRAGADEIISVYAASDEEKTDLKIAAEEDKLDEVYKRIQSRRSETGYKTHREEKDLPDE